MKAAAKIVVGGALAFAASLGSAEQTNPLSTVLGLIDELTAKVIKEGETEAKAYKEFFDWCDDTAKNGEHAVKTATTQKSKLEAKIGELTSNIDSSGSKIDELASAVAQGETELKDATTIRAKEVKDFQASEAELMESIDTLGRAVGVLSKEMAKNPAALAQVDTSSMGNVLAALSAVLDGAAFSGTDQKKLLALVQNRDSDDAEDDELGAPAAKVYKTHSNSILDTLEDLKEKAESQLADLRKAEMNTAHNYDMLKQSLEDQMKADNKDMDDEKASKNADAEAKATAEGDLKSTLQELADSQKDLEVSKGSCMQTAADHEATVNARTEELKVLAQAKKVLEETSSGAEGQSYSLLQVASGARIQSRADLARSEVVAMVKRLARKHHSAALAQLASKLSAAVRLGGADDVFAKVKGLIQDMIAKLEGELQAETDEKAYCDEQMSKTEAKKAEIEDDVARLTSKIDVNAAKSAELKEEIAELQSQLSALAREQAEMDKIRQETHEDYVQAKADLELGLNGVRKALQVLRDYYAAGSEASLLQGRGEAGFGAFMQQPAAPVKHSKASGAGQSIIGILEVVESDFATNLAKEESEESDAQAEYEKVSQENKVTKTNKEQDVKYKSQEVKSRAKTGAELSSDLATENTELAAVNEYYAKIKDRCIARPETYEERKARREAEIAGLKEALDTLENETALLQRSRRLRGRRAGVLQAL